MIWNQNYNPLGWWPLSTLVSALPVATLFFVLLVLRKRVWVSACCGFVMAVVLAAAVFDMPASLIAAAGVEGERARTIELREHSVGRILKGWSPFALASVLIFLWALPEFSRYLRIPFLTVPTPWLHNAVICTPPVTPVPTPEPASMR